MLQSIKNLAQHELEEWLMEMQQPTYRRQQIWDWLYKKYATDFAQMLNLPKALRQQLAAQFLAVSLQCIAKETAVDGTAKFLFRLHDGETIETVLIRAPERLTVCVSTQVGCPVRCAFCATGRQGLVRDLNKDEIVDQVIMVCASLQQRISNLVVMGMGEPLLNLDNLLPALNDDLCNPDKLGLGARSVTISTSGIVPGIYKLAEQDRQWNLALSLHAADEVKRAQLIPAAYRYPLAEILQACQHYMRVTGRKVTLEYTLLPGRNDSEADIRLLAETARDLKAKVNLIPCNPVSDGMTAPSVDAIKAVEMQLLKQKVPVTVRVEKGRAIQAACGQLRSRHPQDTKEQACLFYS